MEGQKLISVGDASLILGVSERQTRRYIKDQKLKAEKEGNAFEVELDSVLELLKSRQPLDPDIEDAEMARFPGIQSAKVNVVKLSDTTEDISDVPDTEFNVPTDIYTVSEKGRTLLNEMSENFDLLVKKLSFEVRRNRDMEEHLHNLMKSLNIKPAIPSHKDKAIRKIRKYLPWILFGISSVIIAAYLLWVSL